MCDTLTQSSVNDLLVGLWWHKVMELWVYVSVYIQHMYWMCICVVMCKALTEAHDIRLSSAQLGSN